MVLRATLAATESGPYEMGIQTNYAIDAAASQFTTQVFSGGLLSAFGHSPIITMGDFSGEARLNGGGLEGSSLKITINAAALAVQSEVSDQDRREMERKMREEVLEVSSYPEIVYECSNITGTKSGESQYAATLKGDLTLHGVTHRQPVNARVTVDRDWLRAFGTFSILQTDYDLTLATAVAGTLRVKNELKFSFNILARKK
jgi:polyisoprenoid-binding protein YceI